MSCGSAEGTGFNGEVMLRVFCPKGTKAMYAEPFSAFGGGVSKGGGLKWDGKSKQSSFGGEFETILQRGTSMKITDAKKKGNTTYLTVYVTYQDIPTNV